MSDEPASPSSTTLGPKQVALLGLGLLAVVALGAWAYFTFFEGPEDKVRRLLGEAAAAAEDRNPRDLTALMTEDFQVAYRNATADREQVRQALTRVLVLDYKGGVEVELVPEPIPVEVSEDGESATARFRVEARGRRRPDAPWQELGQREARGDVVFVATCRRTDEGWRIRRIAFEPRP